MGRWGDGEIGRWGDGEMGRWGVYYIAVILLISYTYFFPITYYLLPITCSQFPIPDSRFPIPVPLLGGVRGGFRFPIPDSRFPTPYSLLPSFKYDRDYSPLVYCFDR
ncbi:hypothetical protein [Moorena producens]|uniref:hypothetical protein n=1 Tax=Moorena producens TaxID=1155739 RepID=UPI003C789C52